MKVKTKDGEIVPLASTISVISGYGNVKWHEIEEFIPEAAEITSGWKKNLKVPRNEEV